jgi:carbon storage regulator
MSSARNGNEPGRETMLILTRKRDGVITIGEDVVVRVMRTGKGSVKIGIEAPAHVKILRGELGPAQAEPAAVDGADAAMFQH